MGVPTVLVDEKGAPVTRPVSDSEILGPPRSPQAGRDAPASQNRRVLRRLPQGHHHPRTSTTTSFCAPSPSTTSGRAPASPNNRHFPSTAKTPSPPARPATCRAEQLTSQGAGRRRQRRHARLASLARRQQPQRRLLQIRRAIAETCRFPQGRHRRQGRPERRHLRAREGAICIRLNLGRSHVRTAQPSSRRLGKVPFSVSPSETLIADVVIQNKGIATPTSPSSATSTSPGSTSPSKTSRQSPHRVRLHSAQRRPRSLCALLHQPPRQHQGRAQRRSTRSGTTACWPTTTPSSPAARSLSATVSACPRHALRRRHHHRHHQVPPLRSALHRLRNHADQA